MYDIIFTMLGGEYKAKQMAGRPQAHKTTTPVIKCIDYPFLCCSEIITVLNYNPFHEYLLIIIENVEMM